MSRADLVSAFLNLINQSANLRAVVEVVPVVASADPVVIGSSIVGLVVGVGRRVVELAGLRVLAGGLGVESSSGLAVEGLQRTSQFSISYTYCLEMECLMQAPSTK